MASSASNGGHDGSTPPVRLIERTADSATLSIPDSSTDDVASRVAVFFGLAGYRLVAGTASHGTYQKGSLRARMIVGVLAAHFKFNVQVDADGEGARLIVKDGLGGRGLILSKTLEEFEQLVTGLQLALGRPRPGEVAPGSSKGTIRERIAQLDELHGLGIVTDEEYAARRARILDDL